MQIVDAFPKECKVVYHAMNVQIVVWSNVLIYQSLVTINQSKKPT